MKRCDCAERNNVYSEKNMTVLIEIHVYSECKKMVVRECIWRYGSDCHHCFSVLGACYC